MNENEQTTPTKQPTTTQRQVQIDANKKTVKYWDRKGRLELWAGKIAMDKLQQESDSHRKNREAEESWARKNVWGANEESLASEDTSMGGNTYLGDITQQPPIIIPQPQPAPQQQQSHWPLVAGLALSSLLPTAAIGGAAGYYFGSQNQPAVVDDESTAIGLGRIEDYFQPESLDDGEN